MKHKHYDLIVAWAAGAEIQFKMPDRGWHDWVSDYSPPWHKDVEYRIKPEEKKPVVRWLWACKVGKNNWAVSGFATEEEANAGRFPLVKLEWSRTEFPE